VVKAPRTKTTGFKFIPDGFSVDFQLKGTTIAIVEKDFVAYDLNARNYDLIVGP